MPDTDPTPPALQFEWSRCTRHATCVELVMRTKNELVRVELHVQGDFAAKFGARFAQWGRFVCGKGTLEREE